ncbi:MULTISPECIES: hypothetical protein [unclassified Streptomyces]|uniref:hypothetical protein n=1 Tax=unclassified Streptomyces TaxID=2593676 RepID=UPI0026EFEFDB|nr:hypothetical protein [Streptomyces sp. HUAS CX7]WKX23664.1 hypothetical protein Q3Y68_36875 [Streptomyces sp. HUAS CX7]
MGRSRRSAAGGGLIEGCISLAGGCIVVVVLLGLFVTFMTGMVDDIDGGPSSGPASPPTTTAETVTPPDFPEEEEEAEADDTGGVGGQDFDGQVGIQFGYACSPVGALGIAGDGRPAKCFMGKDGRARWGYDSNRG